MLIAPGLGIDFGTVLLPDLKDFGLNLPGFVDFEGTLGGIFLISFAGNCSGFLKIILVLLDPEFPAASFSFKNQNPNPSTTIEVPIKIQGTIRP